MERNCIYCGKQLPDCSWILVCDSCCKLWNKNHEKFIPDWDKRNKLIDECEKHIKQAMTGHTCGQEIGGDPRFYGSSTCIGCFPETQQHYRQAADMVICWAFNLVQETVMKNILLKDKQKNKEK